jgi:tetratricopeptide (TPR) repeat protein
MISRGAILGGVLGLALLGAGAAWLLAPAPQAGVPEERLPLPPLPPRLAGSGQYELCLDRIPADPAGAAAMAETWAAGTGGGPALHCLGLARVALGDAAEGAALLTRAAQDTATPPAARAAIYGQTAQAWMIAEDIPRAFAASSLALTFAPDDPDLLIDHAIAAAALDDYPAAVADLTHALQADPQRADALTLRGSAQLKLGKLDAAQDDIDRALTLDPDNAEALLERGILRQRHDDAPGAREDWQRAIALAPDSSAADLAQQNLALLEAGPQR